MDAGLILIDIQKGFDSPVWGDRNNPQAEENAGRLLAQWRARAAPVIHIRHVSTQAGSPLSATADGTAFKPQVMPAPNEALFEKSVNSAFIGTGLEAHLRAVAINRLVICGLTTPHCVSTTARMAANLGFDVTLAHDACAAFTRNADLGWRTGLPPLSAEDIHTSAISHLHGEFVQARSVADILGGQP